MSYSLDFTTHADVINTELRFQQGPTASGGLTEPTSWNPAITYGKNLVVKYGGKYWISTLTNNLNNTPSAGSPFWDSFVNSGGVSNTGMVWKGAWDVAETYSVGDVVYSLFSSGGGNGRAYISVADGNIGNSPPSSPIQWTALSPNATSIQSATNNSGLWVSGSRYLPNAIVRYLANETGEGSAYFVCVADTLGFETIPPATNASSATYWKALDSSTFLGAWGNALVYNKDNTASSGGSVYQSLTDGNVGNTPLTSLTNWTSLGYKALNVPFSTICGATNFTANVPISVKTIALGNVGTYNFARGYGLIYFSAGTFGSAPQIRVYFSETLNGAFPATFDNSIQSVFANTSQTSLAGWVDLSRVMYRSTTGFTTLYLNILFTTGGAGVVCNPVGALVGSYSTSSSVGIANYSAQTTTASGSAGVILMKEPFVPA